MTDAPRSVRTSIPYRGIVWNLLALSVLVSLATVITTDMSQYHLPSIEELVLPVYHGTTTSTLDAGGEFQTEDRPPIIDRNTNSMRQNKLTVSSNVTALNSYKTKKKNGNIDDNSLTADFDVYRWVNKTIRTWGCARTETPAIFVHIGKAGGGMTRARFAAAALDYDREDWHAPAKDRHYYPVTSSSSSSSSSSTRSVAAKFCNSRYRTFNIPNTQFWAESFEGNLPCNATTPIGLALACPEPADKRHRCLGCEDWNSADCHTVYVGHNSLGSELHWLPPRFLQNWWQSTPWAHPFSVDWSMVEPNRVGWCSEGGPTHMSRPLAEKVYRILYQVCSIAKSHLWDERFQNFWLEQTSKTDDILNYSPIYASLPVLRITMVREPWSWLVSKLFWHDNADLHSKSQCDNVTKAQDWAHAYALQYIGYLCGSDCAIRYERGLLSLAELWVQSESNLRQAFTVVGLMNETTTFYEMISTRVAYLDMGLNPHVQGERHGSGRTRETLRCHRVFRSEAFQQTMKDEVPVLRILDHLYKVAVEVNRFQLQELRECQGPQGSLWSKKHFH